MEATAPPMGKLPLRRDLGVNYSAAILSLVLAIGATTAAFLRLVDTIMLRKRCRTDELKRRSCR